MDNKYDYTMLVAEGCPHCEHAKESLKDKIDSGEIKLGDVVKDKDAHTLATKYNVTAVPTFIVKDKTTHFLEVCELSGDGTKLRCPTKELKL